MGGFFNDTATTEIYTAVTRARRLVMIVGREAAIDQMIANVNTRRRYSALCWRLTQLMNL